MSKVLVQLYSICLLLLLTLFAGCHQIDQVEARVEDASSSPLESKSLILRSSSGRAYLSPATEEERQVHTLHAFLFDKSGQKLQEIVTATPIDSEHHDWKVKSAKAGSYQMILLANAPDVAQALQVGCSIEEMERQLITQAPSDDHGFVMRHKGKKPIPVTIYEGRGIDMRHRAILLERLAARVDVNLLATSCQIKSIQLLHAATQSQVYNNNGEGKELEDDPVVAVNATEYTAKLYLYEHNSNDEEAKKTKLQITCVYQDGTALEPITIPFDIIKRNHLYHVKLTEKSSGSFAPSDPKTKDQTLIPSIEVRDWSVGQIFRIDRPSVDALVQPKEPRYNPLAYVAKWNVTTEQKWDRSWVYHEDPKDTNARMNYYKAQELKFLSTVHIEGSKEEYRLPSIGLWQSIIPYKNEYKPTHRYVFFDGKERLYENVNRRKDDWRMYAQVDNKSCYPTSDFWTTTLKLKGQDLKCTVALRYKGGLDDADSIEKYCRSAWLYYRGEMKVTRIVNGQPKELKVPGMYIHCLNIVDMKEITEVKQLDAAWWTQHWDKAVMRFFPTTKVTYTAIEGRPEYNVEGQYMARDLDLSNHDVATFEFDAIEASPTRHSADRNKEISVRLFSRTPLE